MSSNLGNRGHRFWKGDAPFDLHTSVSKGRSGSGGNSPWGDCRRVSGENSSVMQVKLSQLSVAPPSAKLVSDESIGSYVPPKRSKSPYASSSAHSLLASVESTSSPQLKQSTPPCFSSSVDYEEVLSESTSSSHCDLSTSSVVPLRDGFDICYTPTANLVFLKRSLLQKNREKRLQAMCLKNGLQHQRLRPGMFLLEKFLTQEDQIAIIRDCRSLDIGHGGFYKPGYDNGAKLQLQMMCLGKNWNPVTNGYGQKTKRGKNFLRCPRVCVLLISTVKLGNLVFIRDIKGANILVDPNGGIKLADFGMAKDVELCPFRSNCNLS